MKYKVNKKYTHSHCKSKELLHNFHTQCFSICNVTLLAEVLAA